MELETLLQEVEFNNSQLVAASSVTGACLSGHIDKAENQGQQEVARIKSEGLQEQDIDFKNFQGLASIWDYDKSCCEDVGSIDCDLNIGLPHVTDVSVARIQMESGLGNVRETLDLPEWDLSHIENRTVAERLNPCPDHLILESLEPSEFCCEAVDDEIQQFKVFKSIWEEPPLTVDHFPHQGSIHAGFSAGITQMNEETVGCDMISGNMQNFEHIKCIWDAPQAIAECIQIPLHFQTQPVGTVAENSSAEIQPSFELAANVKPFVEDMDPEEQDNLENNEELTLIWEKKKAQLTNVKTSVISAKKKCQPLVSAGLLAMDENQMDKDMSINWDNKETETENVEDFKIPIEEKIHSSSFCPKTLNCETAKHIGQLKAIWDRSEPDIESGNGSVTCWGEPAPVTQIPAEDLPEWDLSHIENRTVAEKSVWHPSKSNSNSSENLSLFWDKCELATENLSELAAEPAAPLGHTDEEHFKDVKCHWNDARADLEGASGSLTGWKNADSDADAFAKLHCEIVLSDFESCKDKLDEKLLFDEAVNVQTLASGSCWAESESKPQFDDLTAPVDGWDAANRCYEHSLDPEKLNKLRALWEDNDVPQVESLRRVASLSCWEQQNPGPDGLRRISSESLWEPLDRSSENLSRANSALHCWQLRDSSSDSLRLVAEDFCWDNDATVMDGVKQKISTSCHNAENLPDVVPVWHNAQAVDNNLRSSQGGDNGFGEEFKELQSIWQNDQFDGESLNKLPRAIQSQDAAAVWCGTLSESRCLPAKFDSISQQQQLDAEDDDESERFTDEMMDKLTCELFCQIDQADCDPCYLQAGNNRNIWLCSASGDFQDSSAYVGGFGTESDELNRLISQLDERQFESRGFKGLLTDVGLRRHNLASEWQLVETFSFLNDDADAMLSAGCDLWRLILQDENSRPKLVPSENTAFRDKIPHRFAYRYSFFDPRGEACRHDRSVSARTETIKHIYDPSHSIMRQLEDVFDDGQRLQVPEDAFRILPNRVFRPIGGRNSGRDSYHSNGTSACSGADLGDLILQVRSPTLDATEMLGPDSPYQLYFGAESKSFVPRFRVHKELEKSAQTGEVTPPMQNNEAVCNMNVILSTMALLD